MTFTKEADFEEALIKILYDKGWEKTVLKHPTEQDLIDNWAKILFDNNRDIDRLDDYPLTDGEMQQIIEQINNLRTPLKLNSFINGKTVSITRDNQADTLHFGKEISLKIYDRREIAAGQSRYQIVQQPLFPTKSKILNDRRGDLMLLIKRDDRLDKIARDIAHHFPRRGFLGKGMVVSVDKFTAVKMYDKVQHYWTEEIKALVAERNTAKTKEEKEKLDGIIKYMNTVEMAVIISEDADEENKFSSQNLHISMHRAKMDEVKDGYDIEDRFKNPNDQLQLVFVCAMWLTGFDVKSLSTLYLDKPMKGHTLMQAIARANRVFPGKSCGIIVDYVNVFKYMQRALSQYAAGPDGDDFPAKDIDRLIELIDQTIGETDVFLKSISIDLEIILAESETFDKLEELRKAFNIIVANDDDKEKFKVLTNTLMNLYDWN